MLTTVMNALTRCTFRSSVYRLAIFYDVAMMRPGHTVVERVKKGTAAHQAGHHWNPAGPGAGAGPGYCVLDEPAWRRRLAKCSTLLRIPAGHSRLES